MPKLSLLHISDIHIGNTFPGETIEEIAFRTVDDISDNSRRIDCIVVTGDIFEGKINFDINQAVLFFETLRDRLNKKMKLNITNEDFIFVPGNHDLKRKENIADFSEYKNFLKIFQSEKYYTENYNDNFLYTIKIFTEQKIAIIGFNSCMLEHSNVEDIAWINEVKRNSGILGKKDQEFIKVIKEYYQSKWDDYGKISQPQLSDAFDELEQKIVDIHDYRTIACFHHHFYPFPENYNKIGDFSLMRNFDDVIKKLQRYNVKIVLHGHKHLPIIRPIVNKEYLSNPDSIIYVFSAGSFAKKGEEQSFQVIDVYSPEESKIAKVTTFNYKKKDLSTEKYSIPPDRKYEQDAVIDMLEMFSTEFPRQYKNYYDEIKEKDSVSARSGIDDIIKNIGKTITKFERVKNDLQNYCERNLVLLLSIHYRINILSQIRDDMEESEKILKDIRNHFIHIKISNSYKQKLFRFLEANKSSEFEYSYSRIENGADQRERIFTAYAAIAIFFTDLYLTFRQYGDFYYKYEGINVNIKLLENVFHRQIPPSTIKFYSDIDRRATFVNFKCTDPTVHKVAVLILKDFEKRMNKIAESFRILGLKIYYLIPKIDKDNYDLENLNFEAYIPTLLPLLTGDNLYTQKEVFIRELIQNSIDAILLREKLDSKPFDKTIKIELGYEKNSGDGELRKYLRITDKGIGMDAFKVERYFTSIGRSYYISEEFSELIKNREINFEHISNFGIGFLSSFMVCEEINVITKSYDNDIGLEINIPNYDGCFFVNNLDKSKINVGTSITLYEDKRRRLDFEKTIKYIRDSMLDIQLKINIINAENGHTDEILPFKLRRAKKLILFVPMDEKGLREISWNKEIKDGGYIEKYIYGLLIDFGINNSMKEIKNDIVCLNSGIKLSQTNSSIIQHYNCNQYYNFPSSYIQLDVARERINNFKNDFYSNEKAIHLLAEQANELITYIKEEERELPQAICDNIYLFFKVNKLPKENLDCIQQKLFHLNINVERDLLLITLQPNDAYPLNELNIIDYEINRSFNIINLLLLKSLILRSKIQQKADFEDEIRNVENLINRLLTMNYIPLSHCIENHVKNKKLMDIISSMAKLEDKILLDVNKRTPFNNPQEIDHYYRQTADLIEFEISHVMRDYCFPINEKDFLHKNEEDLLCKIEEEIHLRFENITIRTPILELLSKKNINLNDFLEGLLFRLFIEPSVEYGRTDGNEYKMFIICNYLKLAVFNKFVKLVKISQTAEFKIELEIKRQLP